MEYGEEWSNLFMSLDSIAERLTAIEDRQKFLEKGLEEQYALIEDMKNILDSVVAESTEMKRQADLYDIRYGYREQHHAEARTRRSSVRNKR